METLREERMKQIYFLSDLHLGAKTIENPLAHERRVVRWLDSIKQSAKAIYLMGDVLDFWFEYKRVVPRGYTRFFGKIAELTDSGVEVHWYIGNHDIWIFDYLPTELGVQMHYAAEEVEIAGRRFYLAHGDGVGDNTRGFRLIRSVFHSKLCQRLFAAIPPSWGVGLAHGWSSHSRKNPKEEEGYRGENSEWLICFAKEYVKEHPIEFFIFGHRHILLDLMIQRNSRVVILGDWITYFSYAVYDGENLRLEQYEDV